MVTNDGYNCTPRCRRGSFSRPFESKVSMTSLKEFNLKATQLLQLRASRALSSIYEPVREPVSGWQALEKRSNQLETGNTSEVQKLSTTFVLHRRTWKESTRSAKFTGSKVISGFGADQTRGERPGRIRWPDAWNGLIRPFKPGRSHSMPSVQRKVKHCWTLMGLWMPVNSITTPIANKLKLNRFSLFQVFCSNRWLKLLTSLHARITSHSPVDPTCRPDSRSDHQI